MDCLKNKNINNDTEIKLLEHQIIHYENIKKSLIQHSRALDASDTGTGKTVV